MAVILGDFIEQFPPQQDSLELWFSPSSKPIRDRWRSQRLSAQFAADYFTNFLPLEDNGAASARRIKEGKGAVSYVANELLENAMKFNDDSSQYKIRFGIHFLGQSEVTAVVFTTNSIKPEQVDRFQTFIGEILAGDPSELYLQQIERSALLDNDSSGLGLLTMLNDYGAKLGWRFETLRGYWPDHSPTGYSVTTVTTMAQIKV